MRIVEYQSTVPIGDVNERRNLLEFLLLEAGGSYHIQFDNSFPHIACINQILLAGSGDDGWFSMKWTPFSIGEEEYRQFVNAYAEWQARRHIQD